MTNIEILFSIALMTVITMLLRATPLLFKKTIANNAFFQFIKDKLPMMIMVVLVYYAVGFQKLAPIADYTNQLIALAVTLLLHLLLRNFLFSIVAGTTCYVVLLNM